MTWSAAGAFLLSIAVMLGAFGAHGLRGRLDTYSLGIYEKAVFYHFVHALGILVDQDTKVQGVWVPFFGRPAHTPRAPADLALRSGAPILVGTSHRPTERPGDGLVFEVTEVPYDPAPADREAEVSRITAACQAIMEDAIRRHPADWVWMHERWKSQPEPPSERG